MQLKINDTLYMQIASSDEMEARIEYKSRIADISDDRMLIEVPINVQTGRMKRLYLGDEISAYYVSEGGVKNYFSTHVLGFKDEGIRLIAIEKPDPSTITQVQRRTFLRVAAELELAITLSDRVRFIALTDDVGGGGISFLTEGKWQLKSGQLLDCWLLIPFKNGSVDHAGFKCEVVRVKQLETGRNQVMVKFAEIADSERQKIIRYCFERQLDLRKR